MRCSPQEQAGDVKLQKCGQDPKLTRYASKNRCDE